MTADGVGWGWVGWRYNVQLSTSMVLRWRKYSTYIILYNNNSFVDSSLVLPPSKHLTSTHQKAWLQAETIVTFGIITQNHGFCGTLETTKLRMKNHRLCIQN